MGVSEKTPFPKDPFFRTRQIACQICVKLGVFRFATKLSYIRGRVREIVTDLAQIRKLISQNFICKCPCSNAPILRISDWQAPVGCLSAGFVLLSAGLPSQVPVFREQENKERRGKSTKFLVRRTYRAPSQRALRGYENSSRI